MPSAVIRRGFETTFGFVVWTPTTRRQHRRTVSRYQTDLTDAEWRVIAPHLRNATAVRVADREIINGMFYVMRAACPWRLLPNDLPPWGTTYRWFAVWRDEGRLERPSGDLSQ